jgi:hypothetical protein
MITANLINPPTALELRPPTRLIKQWLRARHVGQLEIKKQGLPFSPSKLRKQLQPQGDNRATLIVFGEAQSSERAIASMAERE